MKFVVKKRFDDGSKKGPEYANKDKSCDYEVGEIYKGKNFKGLLEQGLIEQVGAKGKTTNKAMDKSVDDKTGEEKREATESQKKNKDVRK